MDTTRIVARITEDAEKLIVKAIEVLPKVFLILLLTVIAYKGMKYLSMKIEEALHLEDESSLTSKKMRQATLSRVVEGTGALLILLVSGMMVIQQLGINIAPIIAGAGIAGLAIGFGAQNLVRDFISGFFILMENQFTVGDVIKIADIGGLVESMNLRITVLRDVEGVVHFIPNGEIKTVSNLTKDWSRALLHVDVAYKENVDEVMKVLREVLDEFKEDESFKSLILKDPVIPGVEKLGDSGVSIRIMIDTKPLKQWDVMRELRRRIKNRFDKEGIEIPFPQRAVWVRAEPAVPAPPSPANIDISGVQGERPEISGETG